MIDDLRLAFLSAWRSPRHALFAALLIALGVCLITGTFAIVDAVLLRKLPAPAPDEFVNISGVSATGDATNLFASALIPTFRRR